jgi:glycosyltransferase involved in cell wall biosynthesis
MKHNPMLLKRLAEELDPDVSVIVVAHGSGMERLETENKTTANSKLKLFSLQPPELFPDVLATGDVLIAIIELEAATFSVPSKILSYMCAGRPILLASSLNNLAARLVVSANVGIVVPPDDVEKLVGAAKVLYGNSKLREIYGRNARTYAEKAFDIVAISKVFESVFQKAVSNAR